MTNIRPPAFAGSFYPSDEEELQKAIDQYIEDANPPKVDGEIKALILPHAGYAYSGPVAASGYKLIKGKEYKNIVIFGPSHKVMFQNIALTNYASWKTPLGIVNLSPLSQELVNETGFSLVNEAHLFEHSIEVQLPFLQRVLKSFKITPLITGRISNHKEIASTLNQFIDGETLIIISSDLCHYLPYDKANEIDKQTIEKILNLDTYLETDQACGTDGILILIELAKIHNWKAKLLDYRNSGDTAGDKNQVVGYSSIVFHETK